MEYPENFKKIIAMFIPGAAKWTYAQLTNQPFIFDAFKKVHGIDYTKKTDSFDNLISMTEVKLSGKKYYRELFYICDMPDSIAKTIWPIDIKKEILARFGEFLKYMRNTKSPQGYDCLQAVLMKSWAYQKLDMWKDDKNDKISKKIKKKIFEFSMGLKLPNFNK